MKADEEEDAAWDAVVLVGEKGELDNDTGGVIDEEAGRILFPGGGSMARRIVQE